VVSALAFTDPWGAEDVVLGVLDLLLVSRGLFVIVVALFRAVQLEVAGGVAGDRDVIVFDVRELVGLLEVVSRISCEDIMLLRKVAHENIGGRLWIASSSASHGARDVLEIVVTNLVVDLDWKRVLDLRPRPLTWFAAVSRRSTTISVWSFMRSLGSRCR